MRLPFQEVTSWEDMTANVSALQSFLTNPGGVAPWLGLLAAQQLAVVAGSTVVSFSASAQSTGTVVTHNIGRTPQAVVATPGISTGNAGIIVYYNNASTTQVTLAADRPAGAITANFTVSYVIIG